MYKWEPNSKWFIDSSDVVFEVEGRTYNLHKIMLARRTAYYGEEGGGDIYSNTVKIPGKLADFECMMSYIYNGECEVKQSNALAIYKLALNMKCSGLQEVCLTNLLQNMSIDTALEVWLLSIKFDHHRTEHRKFYEHLLRNVSEVVEDYEKFMDVELEYLIQFLNNDYLNYCNELKVFYLIVRWIEHKPATRIHKINVLLECVRFEQINIGNFIKEIYSHDIITTNPKAKKAIDKLWDKGLARNIVMSKGIPIYLPPAMMKLRPRICPNQVLTIGGWSSGSPIKDVESFDPRVDEWFTNNMYGELQSRAYHGIACVDKMVYIVGGTRNGDVQLRTLISMDTNTRRVVPLPSMREKRCYVMVTYSEGRIYAMGGFNGTDRLKSVEYYSIKDNNWFPSTGMIHSRSDAGCETFKNMIYVTGGFNGDRCLSKVERFDLQTDQWTALSEMNTLRSGLSFIADKQYIFAVGGFDGIDRLRTVERYEPKYNKWLQVKSMFSCRSNFSCFNLEGYIYATGGFDGTSTTNLSEKYNIVSDRWEEAPSINVSRSASKACMIQDIENIRTYTYYGNEKIRSKRRKDFVNKRCHDEFENEGEDERPSRQRRQRRQRRPRRSGSTDGTDDEDDERFNYIFNTFLCDEDFMREYSS